MIASGVSCTFCSRNCAVTTTSSSSRESASSAAASRDGTVTPSTAAAPATQIPPRRWADAVSSPVTSLYMCFPPVGFKNDLLIGSRAGSRMERNNSLLVYRMPVVRHRVKRK